MQMLQSDWLRYHMEMSERGTKRTPKRGECREESAHSHPISLAFFHSVLRTGELL